MENNPQKAFAVGLVPGPGGVSDKDKFKVAPGCEQMLSWHHRSICSMVNGFQPISALIVSNHNGFSLSDRT